MSVSRVQTLCLSTRPIRHGLSSRLSVGVLFSFVSLPEPPAAQLLSCLAMQRLLFACFLQAEPCVFLRLNMSTCSLPLRATPSAAASLEAVPRMLVPYSIWFGFPSSYRCSVELVLFARDYAYLNPRLATTMRSSRRATFYLKNPQTSSRLFPPTPCSFSVSCPAFSSSGAKFSS